MIIVAGHRWLAKAGYRLAEERAWMPGVFGWPAADIGNYWLAMLEYHLDLADEARQLAGVP